jgi:hypothetical protein
MRARSRIATLAARILSEPAMTTITPTRLPGARAALDRHLDAWCRRRPVRWSDLAAQALFAAAVGAAGLMVSLAPDFLLV